MVSTCTHTEDFAVQQSSQQPVALCLLPIYPRSTYLIGKFLPVFNFQRTMNILYTFFSIPASVCINCYMWRHIESMFIVYLFSELETLLGVKRVISVARTICDWIFVINWLLTECFLEFYSNFNIPCWHVSCIYFYLLTSLLLRHWNCLFVEFYVELPTCSWFLYIFASSKTEVCRN